MLNTAHRLSAVPSAWVQRFAPCIRAGGEILDLACGGGRHARWLAEQAWVVAAVDRDTEALATLRGVSGVKIQCADLENGPWPFAEWQFDGIVVTNYLHRPLLPLIVGALAEGGVLIYETFMIGNERYGKPSNPNFLLQSQELLDVARAGGLRVIAFEEGDTGKISGGNIGQIFGEISGQSRPSVVQRLCAAR